MTKNAGNRMLATFNTAEALNTQIASIMESGPFRVLRGQLIGPRGASERRMPSFEITPQLLVKDASPNL